MKHTASKNYSRGELIRNMSLFPCPSTSKLHLLAKFFSTMAVGTRTTLNHLNLLLLFTLLLSFNDHSHQLQPSQLQSLLRIQNLLNYPSELSSFIQSSSDLCKAEPTPSLTLVCYEDNLTQLHILGSNGGPPPQGFSTGSFFEAVAGISTLKVLSLVSLGMWGQMPPSIGKLTSLEILNVSSNHLSGSIPEELSGLKGLQTLVLDHNRFSGEVPGWLSSLPNLSVLSFKNNSLNGSLPNSLSKLESLRSLSLSMNNLSGEVPHLGGLSNLQVLDLEDNNLGPHFPVLSNRLVSLILRKNRFQFGIPSELGSYNQLQKLDISFNKLEGPIPPSIFTLSSLNYLDVSHNKIKAMLSKNMSCSPQLSYVDLSSNLLSGDLPGCLDVEGSKANKVVLYANNCLSNKGQEQYTHGLCHSEAALAVRIEPKDKEKHGGGYGRAVVASSTMGGGFGAIAIVGAVFLVVRKRNNNADEKKSQTRVIMENVSLVNTAKLLSDARYISQTMKLGAGLPAYRTFSLEELKEATNNFDSSNLVVQHPNGQVHEGRLTDGTLVAVRTLTVRKKQNQQAFTHHIELISKLRQIHLLSSLGHCFDGSLQDDSSTSRIYLVFEFTSNGTLRDYISGKQGPRLTWTQRIAAAVAVAKGIQFLHTGIVPGVFPNNLKITDALVDHDLHVKLSTFNLTLLSNIRTTVKSLFSSGGARHSFPPRERYEEKKDVYDFGVILLEILVGRPILCPRDAIVSKDILQACTAYDNAARRNAVDPAIHHECSDESLRIVTDICLRCLADEQLDRPSVEDVLWNLMFAAQVQESGKGETNKYTGSAVCSPQVLP